MSVFTSYVCRYMYYVTDTARPVGFQSNILINLKMLYLLLIDVNKPVDLTWQ